VASRPAASFPFVVAPAVALGQITTDEGQQLPLLWVWLLAALALLTALAYLLFSPGVRARRAARRGLPIRP
jgi:hypothetical protein